jgi:hypothetical protein
VTACLTAMHPLIGCLCRMVTSHRVIALDSKAGVVSLELTLWEEVSVAWMDRAVPQREQNGLMRCSLRWACCLLGS